MRRCTLCLALWLAAGTLPCLALELSLEQGEDKWGFAARHNTVTQPWNGAPVTLAVEVELFDAPGRDRPALPWQSWLGLHLEDGQNRYALGLRNSGDDKASDVPFGAVFYEKRGNIQQADGDGKYALKAGRLWLRAGFDGKEVWLARSSDGERFDRVWSRPAPEGFAPKLVGVTLNSAQKNSRLGRVAFRNFTVAGEGGPARSDDFTGTPPWTYRLHSVSVLEAPGAAAAGPDRPAASVRIGPEESGTARLAELLGTPGRTATFTAGRHRFGRVEVAAHCRLVFEPGATVEVGPDTQLVLAGDGIELDGARFALPLGGRGKLPIVAAKGVGNLRLLRLSTSAYDAPAEAPAVRAAYDFAVFEDCRDVLLAEGRFGGVYNVLSLNRCRRTIVRDNRATDCFTLATLRDGGEYLQHYGNWSSRVVFQCMWWGGDSNDKKDNVPDATARLALRGLPREAADFKHNAGAYDILVQNNIAEYGTTLVWGSKGRNVVIAGNLARYMDDLAYDTEGGENVVIQGNISINSKAAGIGCYFYGERLLIANNQLLTLPEGDPKYRGQFIRLHSGGDSSHFGNGEALVTGNQMVSAASDKPRAVILEATRNVVIANNTIRNGVVNISAAADDVVLAGNVFTHDLATPPETVVNAEGKGKNWTFRDNRFRQLGDKPAAAAITAKADGCRVALRGNGFENHAVPYALSGSGRLLESGNHGDGTPKVEGDWRTIPDEYPRAKGR